MRALYLDCFSGISGDMTVAALLDLGVDELMFRNEIEKLGLSGYSIRISKKSKSGILGTDFDVILEEHSHEPHSHGDGHHHHHHHERNLYDITKIIDESALHPGVKEMSKKIFNEIALAEAKVHGKSLEEVHFHEVGALDSIIDIVGASICIHLLGVDAVYASALHDGQGFITCAHGDMPVPVPAVMEMLRNSSIPLIIENVNTELITPTGMGIVKTVAKAYGQMPVMDIEGVGYGMGKRETGKFNALRAVIGTISNKLTMDRITILETNIDNMSPEIMGYTVDKLFEEGALDVYQIPIYMKKNRLGTMLGVICGEENESALAEVILRETSSIGVRKNTSPRYILDRKQLVVDTDIGQARVKISGKGPTKKVAPEYEDCKKIAMDQKIPLREVYAKIIGSVNYN